MKRIIHACCLLTLATVALTAHAWVVAVPPLFLRHTTQWASPSSVDDEDYERPEYPIPRSFDESLLGDLTGGRPGSIVETEEQLALKEQIFQELEDGTRQYPKKIFDEYGTTEAEEGDYDIDDPDAIDAAELGTWTIQDLRSKFEYEWDPNSDEPDPNRKNGQYSYMQNEIDDDNVEIGYDPMFGPSNPFDRRTIVGSVDSYMIDERTKDDTLLEPQFAPDDPERTYNEDIVQFRKSLDIVETYVDPFLEASVPRHVAKWHGYPEQTEFEPKNFTNNRFTAPRDRTDFDALSPFDARKKAVELARSQNAEWLPNGQSQEWHRVQRQPYEQYQTLIGTLQPGFIDQEIRAAIQPALDVLGSCATLLSMEGPDQTVFRFHYFGLMKNKFGMQCWTESMIQDCGVEVTGVVFETGFRKRDAAYDGGDGWNGPSL